MTPVTSKTRNRPHWRDMYHALEQEYDALRVDYETLKTTGVGGAEITRARAEAFLEGVEAATTRLMS